MRRIIIGTRCMMEACEKEKAKYEWMWKRSSEISECECEFECMERSKCAWREDNECAILV
jgi:hypothetical protein